jgi:hypothetical protein
VGTGELEAIADPGTGRTALIGAIRGLGPVTEPASFWSDIAGDDAFGAEHRRRAVVALFRRHVVPGTTLADLARALDDPAWLRDDDFSVVDVLGGKIPVSWTSEDTVLALGVLPELSDESSRGWAIYLRLGGTIDMADVLALLHGATVPPEVQGAEILEVGFEPPEP